jgi:hypothetical protein
MKDKRKNVRKRKETIGCRFSWMLDATTQMWNEMHFVSRVAKFDKYVFLDGIVIKRFFKTKKKREMRGKLIFRKWNSKKKWNQWQQQQQHDSNVREIEMIIAVWFEQ